jgi:RHS repeat-associated protein
MPTSYGYDGHGNVRFLANTAGAITDSYDFDAFGMTIRTSGATPNPFFYSSERLDGGTGLYDLRARYYDQATGRFWGRDPVEGKKCCGLSWNPYIFVRDDPSNNADPTGREVLILYLVQLNETQYQARHFARPIGQCLGATLVAEGALFSDYQLGRPVEQGANTRIVGNFENLFAKAALNLTTPSFPLPLPPNGAQCQNPIPSAPSGSPGDTPIVGGVTSGNGGSGNSPGGFGGGTTGGAGATTSY